MNRLLLCSIIVGAAVIAAADYAADQSQKPSIKEAPQTYPTKEACERSAQKQCAFIECDYIPKGKTFDEVCGKNFKEGWVPKS